MRRNNKEDYYKVKTLWEKNFTTDEIVQATGLPKLYVLDITQKIFGNDMKRKYRKRFQN